MLFLRSGVSCGCYAQYDVSYGSLNRLPVPSKISHTCNEIDNPPFTNEEWNKATENYASNAGIGDQLRRIAVTFLLSVVSQRVFTVYWSKEDLTMQTLQPNEIDWTFFKEQLGMHRDRDISSLAKKEDYLELSRLLHSNRQHITISHEVSKSYFSPFEEPTLKRYLDELGITQLFDKDKNLAWVFVTGMILRYLFKFPHEVITKLERTQKLLGIHNQKYLAIHIRTGFLGTDFEETTFFDPHKAFKNISSWRQSLECSLRLADDELGPTSPILLGTDSYEVKKWAIQTYGDRVKVTETILYHVALKDSWNKVNTRAEFIGTWVDLLLLARAHIFIHSTSGFSLVAGAFCSTPRQFGLPDCHLL